MIEDLFEQVEVSIADVKKKFYGVATGRVINLADPMTLGRVQVQLPFLDSVDLSPWARVATGLAGPLHGHYFLPNIGDEVLVAFEHGDVNAPYIIGSLWNALSPPPMPTPLAQISGMRTLMGNQIVFTDAPPTVTIQNGPTPPEAMPMPPSPSGPYATILLSPAGIQIMSPTTITLMVGQTSLILSAAGIQIVAPTVSVVAEGEVELTGGTVNILGGMVQIN